MSNAFVIEINDEAAGIVVKSGHDYRFHAANARYAVLEGRPFSSPSRAETAVHDLRRRGEISAGVSRLPRNSLLSFP